MAVSIEGGGFDFSTQSIQGTWSWRIQASNLADVGQTYEFTNINTPFGPLINTQIPIPGDVITAMADSLVDIQSQLAPLLQIDSSSSTSFVITITEGDSNIAAGIVNVLNAGAFGSFMTATATPSTSWLSVSPTSIQNLGKNESGQFSIEVLTATLLNSSSPYSGVINLQDNRNQPTVIPVSVTVVVNPRPVLTAGSSSLTLTYVLSTQTPGVPQILTISNSGPLGSSLDFTVATLGGASWLDITPLSGSSLASGDSTDLTVSVVSSAVPYAAQTLTETIRISSSSASNSPLDIPVSLIVS